jgi:hypothetical protein
VPTSTSNVNIPGKFAADGQNLTFNFTSPDPSVVAVIDGNGQFAQGDIKLGGLSADVNTGTPVQLLSLIFHLGYRLLDMQCTRMLREVSSSRNRWFSRRAPR